MQFVITSHLKNAKLYQHLTLLWNTAPFHTEEKYPITELLLCERVYAQYQFKGENHLVQFLREMGIIEAYFKDVLVVYLSNVKYTFTITKDNIEAIYDNLKFIKTPLETKFFLRDGLIYIARHGNNFNYNNERIVLKFSYKELILNEFLVGGYSNNHYEIRNNKVFFNDKLLTESKRFQFNYNYTGYINVRKDGSLESLYIADGTKYHILNLELYDNGVLKSLHSYWHGYLDGPFIDVDSRYNVTEGYYDKNLLTGYFRNNLEEGNFKIKGDRSYKVGLWYINGQKHIYSDYAEKLYPVVTL